MTERSDRWHEAEYKAALRCAQVEGPEWSDLTEEQRGRIRTSNIENQKYFDELGAAIATGGELPHPFGGKNDEKGATDGT